MLLPAPRLAARLLSRHFLRLIVALNYGRVVRRHVSIKRTYLRRFGTVPGSVNLRQNGIGRRGYNAALNKAGERRPAGEQRNWVLLTIQDITDARLAEQQKDALLREKDDLLRERRILIEEVQHRIANSLQIIASILMLKARAVQSEESRRHLEDAHQRVISVAAIQEQLRVGLEDVAVHPYLTKLCESLSASMIQGSRPIMLAVEADGSTVNPRDAVSIGLVVTELVINALKHAFGHHQKGTIIVSYRRNGHGWTLAVQDDGVGLPSVFTMNTGLGTSLVAALAGQLRCSVVRKATAPGLQVSLVHENGDHVLAR